jgi:hypothetical protein
VPRSTDHSTVPSNVGLPDDAELEFLERKVDELSTAFAGSIEGMHEALNTAARRFESESAAIVSQAGRGSSAPIADAARHITGHKLEKYRTSLLAETQRNREDMLGQLQSAYERLDLSVRATPSPVAMLGMSALGQENRQRYESQLAGAGPATVGNAAIRAVATGDLALGAAVLARLDAIPKEQRPIQPQDLAARMVGARHAQLVHRTERARISFIAARDADRSLRTGRSDAVAKISRGLAVRKLATSAPDCGDKAVA